MRSTCFHLVLILQELKKLDKTVTEFKDAYNSYNASDERGPSEKPVIDQGFARQDNPCGLSAERV
jgi:hypothetical protein